MAAKFEISKDHAGKFRFHLKAMNDEIIAAKRVYETRRMTECWSRQHSDDARWKLGLDVESC